MKTNNTRRGTWIVPKCIHHFVCTAILLLVGWTAMQAFLGEQTSSAAESDSYSLEGGLGYSQSAQMESDSFQMQGGTTWTQDSGLESESFTVQSRQRGVESEPSSNQEQASQQQQGGGGQSGGGGYRPIQSEEEGETQTAPATTPTHEAGHSPAPIIPRQQHPDSDQMLEQAEASPSQTTEHGNDLNEAVGEQEQFRPLTEHFVRRMQTNIANAVSDGFAYASRLAGDNTQLASMTTVEAAVAVRLSSIYSFESAFASSPAYELAAPSVLGMRPGFSTIQWLVFPFRSLRRRRKRRE